MNKSESIKELASALCKFQAIVDGAKKTANNPFYKSKYADLGTIWETIRQPLTDNGLAVIQTTDSSEAGTVCVETVLAHTSGEWVSGSLTLKITKDDPQGAGSAITYARRYGLAAILGIHQEDDDAETHRKAKPNQKPLAKTALALIKAANLSDADRAKYMKALDAAVEAADPVGLQQIIDRLEALPKDDAHSLQMEISEILKGLIAEGVGGYESETRRKNSFQKHLGTDTLRDCQDVEKLSAYRDHLSQITAEEVGR